MLEPINAIDCRRLETDDGKLGLKKLFSAPSPDFPGTILENQDLSRLSISSDDIVRLSTAFVEQRMAAFGGLTLEHDASFDCPVLFLPVKSVMALHYPIEDRYYCVVTLGLMELLKYHATVSVWQSQMLKLQKVFGVAFEQVSTTERFFNLRSLMFLAGFGTLPRLEQAVTPFIRRRAAVIAEVVLTFVLLHEVGHGKYTTLGENARQRHRESISLKHEEELNASKIEELFADEYALSRFPGALQSAAIQASMTYFQLLNFLEAAGFKDGRSHPSALNRIVNLISTSSPSGDSYDEWLPILEDECNKMKSFYYKLRKIRRKAGLQTEAFFSEIKTSFPEGVDWQKTVQACELLMSDEETAGEP